MLRITTAVIAITVMTGAAYAAPVPALTDDNDLVINIVDDATSETDAIQLNEGKEPYAAGGSMQNNPPAASGPSGNLENQEYDRETNQ